MSSTYAPVPFSYLAGGSQAPKTGFRRDDGLYGSRHDMGQQPIPALRHDQPRIAGDWSIDQRLRGGDLSPKPAERRRPPPQDSAAGDTESVLSSHSNIREPRPDVSLYQSQIAGPIFGSSPAVVADTPSGHYSNRSPADVDDDACRVDDQPSTTTRTHVVGGGVFDNFILKGPGVQRSRTDVGTRRSDRDERRPTRLEQLFDDRTTTMSDVAPTPRRRGSDVGTRPTFTAVSIDGVDSAEPPGRADETTTGSYIGRASGFGIGDNAKFDQRSSATDSEAACTRRCCCSCSSDVYCSRCRLFVLVGIAVFVVLLMLAIGFVAGWFAYQLHNQQAAGSLAAEGNATASTGPGQTESTTWKQVNATAVTETGSDATTSTTTSTSTSASVHLSAPATTTRPSTMTTRTTASSIHSSPTSTSSTTVTSTTSTTTYTLNTTTASTMSNVSPMNVSTVTGSTL